MRFLLILLALVVATPALARPHLVFELETGRVVSANEAFHPWHPASLTKMMTAYTVLEMIRAGEVGPDTNVMMTWWASQQQPSKMGFSPGTLIPLRDALAMIAVKSANDVSQAIAESLSDRKPEDFYARMNDHARRLGMEASNFVNPHGLHHPEQVTSARDMGLLIRALARDHPDWMWLWNTPAIRVEPAANVRARTYRSFNALLGRFEGANGMKSGYVCASGWNLSASAMREGRTVVAIVFGRNNGTDRAVDAAKLIESAFDAGPAPADRPTVETLSSAEGVPQTPPNLRPEICDVRPPATVEPPQYLPAGVQGPPGPPRNWLAPRPKNVQALAVRTAGRIEPARKLTAVLPAIPVPDPRPKQPSLDGFDLVPSPYPTVPAERPAN